MTFKKFLTAGIMFFAFATTANAELQSVKFTPEEEKSEGWTALLGVGGGNALVADDGAIFANLRIGIQWNPLLASGVFANFLVSDVRNYNVPQKQMIDYNSFGAFVELFPLRFDKFSISVPLNVGGGAINIIENGDNNFSSEDYFFVADMSVHFNYRITKMLEVSIGGGYRMFAGIEENGLENLDLCTPFGELRFTIKE
ncbi:MAG: hypothetical protein MJY98_02045 [Fibrobacter sp.]|nr:hypothetical protein [Fibrobacter sp.]